MCRFARLRGSGQRGINGINRHRRKWEKKKLSQTRLHFSYYNAKQTTIYLICTSCYMCFLALHRGNGSPSHYRESRAVRYCALSKSQQPQEFDCAGGFSLSDNRPIISGNSLCWRITAESVTTYLQLLHQLSTGSPARDTPQPRLSRG